MVQLSSEDSSLAQLTETFFVSCDLLSSFDVGRKGRLAMNSGTPQPLKRSFAKVVNSVTNLRSRVLVLSYSSPSNDGEHDGATIASKHLRCATSDKQGHVACHKQSFRASERPQMLGWWLIQISLLLAAFIRYLAIALAFWLVRQWTCRRMRAR